MQVAVLRPHADLTEGETWPTYPMGRFACALQPHIWLSSSHGTNFFDFHTMNALLCEPESLPAGDWLLPDGDGQVRSQVWNLLAAVYPSGRFVERRQEQRYPYPRLITLWPMEGDGETPSGPSVTVVGKHLSERGLGFFHPQPLPNRLVVVSLEKGDGRWFSFLLDVHRCRFTRQGWYESGGRFLDAVTPPTARKVVAG